MTIEEFKKFVQLCTELKVQEAHWGDCTIVLRDEAFGDVVQSQLPIPDKDAQMPSDEELMNWSTNIAKADEPKN